MSLTLFYSVKGTLTNHHTLIPSFFSLVKFETVDCSSVVYIAIVVSAQTRFLLVLLQYLELDQL
jgi:hypothetical protein